jgi:hypothetical protein
MMFNAADTQYDEALNTQPYPIFIWKSLEASFYCNGFL